MAPRMGFGEHSHLRVHADDTEGEVSMGEHVLHYGKQHRIQSASGRHTSSVVLFVVRVTLQRRRWRYIARTLPEMTAHCSSSPTKSLDPF